MSKTKNIPTKLAAIYDDLSHNITKIYGRDDLLMAIDLIYHSVLRFKFLGHLVTKGWVEGLIIGDTRTGKSETVSRIIEHYKAGELITGENLSYAGLIGGLQQVGGNWSITWGKIPLNNRRLVALDEVSSLDPDMISNMSGVRAAGIAEIQKIQQAKTSARTRIIWLSNPRSGRMLETYNYGVLAVRELIPRVEDIARFDFAIACSSKDVPVEDINKIKHRTVPHKFTSDLCSSLVHWAWSRRPEDVKFKKEAELHILEEATRLGRTYSSNIPLVEANEQRIKLARLSVSLACRLFSTDKQHRCVIVTKDHVEEVVSFLERAYNNDSMGYSEYSKANRPASEVTKDQLSKLVKEFKALEGWDHIRDALLEHQTIRKFDLLDEIGYDREQGRVLFKWLSKNKFIKSTEQGFVKQASLTQMLKVIAHDKYDQPERSTNIEY